MNIAGPCWPDEFSPYRQVSQIPPSEVQAFFREVLARWGKPQRIRVDHGHPWGQVEGLPMPLVLWLMGLGIEVTWIPPRKPQYNGTVERAQGVLQQWAEPKHWPDEVEGQRRLDWAIAMQREGYRGADGKTRAERFPQLAMNPRSYVPEREEEEWCLAEVDRHLATISLVRRVGKTGQITLYGWAYSVGRGYARQNVGVGWDAQARQWCVYDEQGREIKRLMPKQFDAQAIRALQVAYVKPSRQGQTS